MGNLGPEGGKPTSEPTITSTVSIVLDAQPSCLEFARRNDLLVVGTYNLESKQNAVGDLNYEVADQIATPAQKRTGSLLVFHITEQEASLLQTKTLPYALLDLHFSPKDPSIFAVATSDGSLCFFSLDIDRGGKIEPIRSIQICDPSILVLSLAYRVPAEGEPSLIAVTMSNGHLAVLSDEQETGDMITFPVHSQEAWTVAWSDAPNSESEPQGTLYSGGDDSALYKYSAGFPVPALDEKVSIKHYQQLSRDVSTHWAGVTAIRPTSLQDDEAHEILLTGSYDEYVRVLTLPSPGRKRAKVLAERKLDGGVWRLSNIFSHELDLHGTTIKVLASCMHAGAKVLEIRNQGKDWSIEVLANFTEHESMNYASDVRAREGGRVFVSTSFYDRKLCIWNLNGGKDT
ncbi:hypothetical protein ACLMJK_000345 [Lecanora helva]